MADSRVNVRVERAKDDEVVVRGVRTGTTNAALLGFVEKNPTAEAQRSRRMFLCVLLLCYENASFTEIYTAALFS